MASPVDIILTGGSTTLLSLSTTAILATYVATPSLYCTAGEQTFFIVATRNATIGTVTVALEISQDDTNFLAVQSKRQDNGTVNIEHAFALAAGANRVAITCSDARRSASMRVKVKADVGGGAGESVVVTGRAW